MQIQNPAGGVQTAEAVLLPLGRRTMLGFGTPGIESDTNIRLSEEESQELAEHANALTLSRAYLLAFCHPDDRGLLAPSLPEVGPLFRVGGVHEEHKTVIAAVPQWLQPQVHGRRQAKRP